MRRSAAALVLVLAVLVTKPALAQSGAGDWTGGHAGEDTEAAAAFTPGEVSAEVGQVDAGSGVAVPVRGSGSGDPSPCTHTVLPYWSIADAFGLPSFGAAHVDDPHHLVVCHVSAIASVEFWPVGEPVPADVLEAVVRSAVGNALVVPPAIKASPDGVEVPFLVQLPTLFWVEPGAWVASSATASIPELELSVTATLTPDHMVWDPGDGSAPIRCTRNVPYDGTEAPTGCSHIYTSVNGGDPVTVTASAVYLATVSCQPVDLCANLVQPGPVTASHSLQANIIQVRGTLIS